MRVLVTGGSGFIGRNLVPGLRERGHEVLAPTHGDLELTDADRVREYLAANRPDAIVHSATKPGHRAAKDPTGIHEANVSMFESLASDESLCPWMVFLSTGAVYDAANYEPKMPESYAGTHVPADETGRSKLEIARRIEGMHNAVELRPFGVYGPHEDYSIRFLSNALCKALLGMPVTLRQDRMFDYLWVGDLVTVVAHFLETSRSRLGYAAYNVTPDRPVSLADAARMAIEAAGTGVPLVIAAPGLGVEYSGDNARLREEMPEIVFTDIRDGIGRLCEWYRTRLDTIDRAKLESDA